MKKIRNIKNILLTALFAAAMSLCAFLSVGLTAQAASYGFRQITTHPSYIFGVDFDLPGTYNTDEFWVLRGNGGTPSVMADYVKINGIKANEPYPEAGLIADGTLVDINFLSSTFFIASHGNCLKPGDTIEFLAGMPFPASNFGLTSTGDTLSESVKFQLQSDGTVKQVEAGKIYARKVINTQEFAVVFDLPSEVANKNALGVQRGAGNSGSAIAANIQISLVTEETSYPAALLTDEFARAGAGIKYCNYDSAFVIDMHQNSFQFTVFARPDVFWSYTNVGTVLTFKAGMPFAVPDADANWTKPGDCGLSLMPGLELGADFAVKHTSSGWVHYIPGAAVEGIFTSELAPVGSNYEIRTYFSGDIVSGYTASSPATGLESDAAVGAAVKVGGTAINAIGGATTWAWENNLVVSVPKTLVGGSSIAFSVSPLEWPSGGESDDTYSKTLGIASDTVGIASVSHAAVATGSNEYCVVMLSGLPSSFNRNGTVINTISEVADFIAVNGTPLPSYGKFDIHLMSTELRVYGSGAVILNDIAVGGYFELLEGMPIPYVTGEWQPMYLSGYTLGASYRIVRTGASSWTCIELAAPGSTAAVTGARVEENGSNWDINIEFSTLVTYAPSGEDIGASALAAKISLDGSTAASLVAAGKASLTAIGNTVVLSVDKSEFPTIDRLRLTVAAGENTPNGMITASFDKYYAAYAKYWAVQLYPAAARSGNAAVLNTEHTGTVDFPDLWYNGAIELRLPFHALAISDYDLNHFTDSVEFRVGSSIANWTQNLFDQQYSGGYYESLLENIFFDGVSLGEMIRGGVKVDLHYQRAQLLVYLYQDYCDAYFSGTTPTTYFNQAHNVLVRGGTGDDPDGLIFMTGCYVAGDILLMYHNNLGSWRVD
ncbi:MAG: hypothetical protein FWE62_04735, partial [Firmicutes bacterium]|nr:hypothetical protein [Bacillota bacterium]